MKLFLWLAFWTFIPSNILDLLWHFHIINYEPSVLVSGIIGFGFGVFYFIKNKKPDKYDD
jgi:hypothetical protein